MDHDILMGYLCESCAYTGKTNIFYDVLDFRDHVKQDHWRKAGVAGNGQSRYLCSECDFAFQRSSDRDVIDFGGNVFCSVACMRDSYSKRFQTRETALLLLQEKKDEEYVRESIMRVERDA